MTSSHHSNRASSSSYKSGEAIFIAKKTNKNRQNPTAEVNTLLRDQLSHLWPAISNITACQKVCVVVLPQLFLYCQVLHVDADQLTLAAPNSALASKLKQQLPKLQDALQKAGWQINAIRIKVQVNPVPQDEPHEKQCQLSATALAAFSELEKNLGKSERMKNHNADLLGALRNLISRTR